MWRLLFLSFFFFFLLLFFFFFSYLPNEVYRTNTKHIQVWTPGGPNYTDPLSALLAHFSRSQTHFCPENRKLQILITLSFMMCFWRNFVGLDLHMTPSCWPTFRWPWPIIQVKLEIDPKFFVTGLAKSRHRRIIVCAISFPDFQPMWSQSTNVTDRQTDGRHAIARPRFVLGL